MINCQLTTHAMYDRRNRLTYIHNTVGFGDVVEFQMHQDGKLLQLTDTGVVLVRGLKTPDRPLITAYIATVMEAITIFYTATNMKKMPNYLWKKVQRNQRFVAEQPNNQFIILYLTFESDNAIIKSEKQKGFQNHDTVLHSFIYRLS